MRVKQSFAALVSLGVLLLGGTSVFAQYAPGAYPTGPPAPPANYNASLVNPQYYNYPAAIPPVAPPMVDGAGVNPWPTTSPFDFSFGNHYNEGGLWNHREETR